jgi:MFS family permease
MTGPVQLLVGLALLAGVVLLGWLVHRFTKTVVPYEAGERRENLKEAPRGPSYAMTYAVLIVITAICALILLWLIAAFGYATYWTWGNYGPAALVPGVITAALVGVLPSAATHLHAYWSSVNEERGRLSVKADTRPDFGIHKESEEPVRNDGGGYEWKDGRITRDQKGKEPL